MVAEWWAGSLLLGGMELDWVEKVSGSQALKKIFGNQSISATVHLNEVVVSRDGPSATLRMDLESFPSQPPSKWLDAGNNTVQIEITLINVQRIALAHITRNMTGTVQVGYSPMKKVEISIVSAAVDVRITGEDIVLTKISAYRNS